MSKFPKVRAAARLLAIAEREGSLPLSARRRRRMLETTALRSPIGGRILFYTELQPRSPGSGVQPGGRGGSEIRAHSPLQA